MRYLFIFVLLLLASSAAASRSARPLSELQVIDSNSGQVRPLYHHFSQDWFEGTPGKRFQLRLKNHSAERLLVVLSVDGINAVTGETAGVQQRGYVLDPYQLADIDGWRKSWNEVAEFYFTHVADSYAGKTGRPQNVGVIGAAVFREKSAPIAVFGNKTSDSRNQPASSPLAEPVAAEEEASADRAMAAANPQRKRLGTGHGDKRYSPVNRVAFDPMPHPTQIINLRYEDRQSLIARGVLPPPHRAYPEPQAFPIGFVPDP